MLSLVDGVRVDWTVNWLLDTNHDETLLGIDVDGDAGLEMFAD